MSAQYQQERQVMATIGKYHHQATRAEQVRLARSTQLTGIATVTMSLRATLGTVQARFPRVPVEAMEPAAKGELVVMPADSAVVA